MIPDIEPEPSMVATTVLLLLQLPELVISVRALVAPVHAFSEPEITDGSGLTVMGVVVLQPEDSLYVIVTGPLPAPPVTIPVARPTDAMVVELLVHVPPVIPSVSKVVEPEQTLAAPDITEGEGFIVIVILLEQPTGAV